MNIRDKVVSALRWSTSLRFLSQLITWAMSLVVIRILDPEDYGLMAIASAFIAFFTMVNQLGIGAALVQRPEANELEQRQSFGLVLAINTGLFILIFAASPLVAVFFEEPELTGLIRLLACQLILVSFLTVPESLLLRNMDFKSRAIVELVAGVTSGGLVLAMAFRGYGVWSLVTGSIAHAAIRVIGINIAHPFLKLPSFDFRGAGHLVKFGGLITLDRTLWFFFSQADVFIIGKLLGAELLGFYSVALHIASLPMQKINGIINSIAFPAFARIQNDREQVGAYLKKSLQILAFFSFPVFFGISAVAPEFVTVILGEKWLPVIPIIVLLSLVMPLRMASTVLTSTLHGVGRADISFMNKLIATIIMPPAFLVGAQFGLIGVCLAWLVGFPVVFGIESFRASQHIRLRPAEVFQTMLLPGLIAVAMYLAVWSGRSLLSAWVPDVTLLILLVSIGAATYGLLTLSLNKSGYQDLIGLVKG
ncbi:MAG: lipopolysaccharide biosynthesis protein [Gammaproteobacteria bacterium]